MTIHYVTNNLNTGVGSLRNAVALAVSGDEIVINAGIGAIVLTSAITVPQDNLTIRTASDEQPNAVIRSNKTVHRAFKLTHEGAPVDFIVRNLTFSGFTTTNKGAAIGTDMLYTDTRDVRINAYACNFVNCKVTGANATGGAIYTIGTVETNSCSFSVCTALLGKGGAVYVQVPSSNTFFGSFSFVASDCSFSDCVAQYGGAVYDTGAGLALKAPTALITYSSFEGNQADYNGAVYYGGALSFHNLTITDNEITHSTTGTPASVLFYTAASLSGVSRTIILGGVLYPDNHSTLSGNKVTAYNNLGVPTTVSLNEPRSAYNAVTAFHTPAVGLEMNLMAGTQSHTDSSAAGVQALFN